MTTAILAANRWLNRGLPPTRHPWRRAIGAVVLLAGGLSTLADGAAALWRWAGASPAIGQALLATLLTAAATGAGAAPLLLARQVSQRVQASLLGFGAGVMLAATAFSLVLPAFAAGEALMGNRLAAGGIAAAGVGLGGLALMLMDRLLPHEHSVGAKTDGARAQSRRIWLFVAAITLHNLPEGLAVGVAFGDNPVSGAALALGIAVQNMPEGLVVALALTAAGYSRPFAAMVAFASGLVEPIGGLLGAGLLAISQVLLPWGLAFAGGAMLFVVSHEIIPESHRGGHEREATLGVLVGFVVMMLLDTTLG